MTGHDDPFEQQVVEWLSDRGRTTASDVRHAADGIAQLPPRGTASRRSLLTAAATIAVVIGVGAILVGRVAIPDASSPPPDPVSSTSGQGLGSASPSPRATRPAATDPTEPIGTPRPSIPDVPAPAWAADLAGQLACEGPAATLGGEVPSFGYSEPYGRTAEDALTVFLGPSNPYASLPTTGFTPLDTEPHWADFVYAVDGRAKAIVVLTDTSEFGPGWTVAGLRACDASEFDPATPLTFPVTVWTDASGGRLSTETIRSHEGPAHCGFESATWLYVGRQLFFRDPKHVMADWISTTYDADASKPKRAADSGYRSGETQLWIDPKGDAYLVGPDRVERWPRSTDPDIGCA